MQTTKQKRPLIQYFAMVAAQRPYESDDAQLDTITRKIFGTVVGQTELTPEMQPALPAYLRPVATELSQRRMPATLVTCMRASDGRTHQYLVPKGQRNAL